MRLRSLLTRISFFVVLIALSAGCLPAQAPLEPPQLPDRTIFYLIWRGTPAGEARKSNSLMSLWDDPDFAPVRAALANNMMNGTKSQKDPKEKPGLSSEEIASFATLLDNPFTIGYLPREGAPSKPVPPDAKPPEWNGMFFVYDRSGKEELLSKFVLRMRARSDEIPTLTEVTVAGVKALKVTRKSGTNYWAEIGKYAVSATEPAVFEEILKRVTSKSTEDSLAGVAAYREAKPLLSGGFLEFFLRVPQIKDIAGDSTSPYAKMLWSNIRLDAVHVFAGNISLEGPRTRLQGAILGDTSEGYLFDIWSAGQKQPDSFAYVTPATIYYHESQFDLLGIYHTLKSAFSQSGQNSAALAAGVESAAQTRIGMPLSDAFALTTGEFGSLQNSPALEDDKKVYFLGIRNKPDTLKLMRTIFSDKLTSEHDDGDVTYLKISLGGNQGSKGVAQWNFYHLAMTPNLLLGASKSETLEAAIAQADAARAGSLPKNLEAARKQFPGKLNGFSYFDLQKVDWPALQKQWADQAAKSAAAAKNTDSARKSKQWNELLLNVNPQVFPRHLHSMTGASWKDASGVHFDNWVD
jgi:hypothetical protein